MSKLNPAFAGVNTQLGANFARGGGIMGMFGKDRESAQLEKQIAAQIMLQKMLGEQGLALEGKRGAESRLTEGTKGEEGRKTGKATTDNEARIKELEQELEMLKGSRTIARPTTPGGKLYDGSGLGDATIKGQLQDQLQTSRIKATPEFESALGAGMGAAALSPGFANQKMGTVDAPLGSTTVTPPSGFSQPPALGKWPQIMGGMQSETVTPAPLSPGGFPMGDAIKARTTTPGGVRQPVDPAILQKAQQMQAPTNAMPSNQDALLRQIIQQMLMQKMGQQ